jgi:hypothetical protein
MKTLTNNQSNKLLFVNTGIISSELVTAEVSQIGSDSVLSLPIVVDSIDCFAVILSIQLLENQLQNATYILKILNTNSEVIFSTTARVDGNTDENRSYVVLDKLVYVNTFDLTFDTTFK